MKKKLLLIITTMLLTGFITFTLCFYNIKIVGVKNGNITIDLFGFEFIYYFEN